MPANPANRPQRETAMVVGVRSLPDQALRDIGKRYELANIRFRATVEPSRDYVLPVLDSAGERIGFLTWDPARPGSAMLPTLLMTMLASMAAIVSAFAVVFQRLRRLGTELATDEERAQRLAHHDHLSGLLNRAGFEARLAAEMARSERNHAGFALHLVDLDRFKQVNDTLGHQAGDEVIKETARRIAGVVRGADVVARLGGDEFGVIQIDTDSTHEASSLAERLREAITRPMDYHGVEIGVGCSIGIALGPTHDTDHAAIMKLADSALYEAKNNGRGRYRFYEAGADASLRMKQLVEEELRDAIANDQLELHYQPQVSADGARIVGLEALVRWRHPTRGMIPPLDFIPIAEQRGLIIPLGNWVIRRACADARRFGDIKIAVNLSAAQIKQASFSANLMREITQAGIDPALIELELTEGMIVEDELHAAQVITALRDKGVSFALDDFGTGYSSLIYLRRFSFDKIKIDRSFLEAVDSQGESAILLHSVVHLGRALGLTVCAEGVESAEQHRFLQAIGCHQLQGYHFAKPMRADDIALLLDRDQPFASVA
jgi:diguanylate cyclase (GGDEF)-like protein